jgi:3-oxoacyl-[acyl-carrier-protein] synthase I
MNNNATAIQSVGLLTSVGCSTAASCAAIRAKVTNLTPTHYLGKDRRWISAHQIPLAPSLQGRKRLAHMAALAIIDCLQTKEYAQILKQTPVILCVAETDRPGRLDAIDELLMPEIEAIFGIKFLENSRIVPHGRVSVAVAMMYARELLLTKKNEHVLIVAVDSLISRLTLDAYGYAERLINKINSNGFVPGEAAGALLVSLPVSADHLLCMGIGLSTEKSTIDSELPLRADGLTKAIKEALNDAKSPDTVINYRITDLSGEHYYFREASLALSRSYRKTVEDFDIWHPAESIGECGSAAGLAVIALASEAYKKSYAPGHTVLAHMSNDNGARAAMLLNGEH